MKTGSFVFWITELLHDQVQNDASVYPQGKQYRFSACHHFSAVGFLSLSTLAFWARHCKMFSSIPGIHPLNGSSTPTHKSWQSKTSPDSAKCPPPNPCWEPLCWNIELHLNACELRARRIKHILLNTEEWWGEKHMPPSSQLAHYQLSRCNQSVQNHSVTQQQN